MKNITNTFPTNSSIIRLSFASWYGNRVLKLRTEERFFTLVLRAVSTVILKYYTSHIC